MELAAALVEAAGPAKQAVGRLKKLATAYGIPASALAPLDAFLAALAPYDLQGVPVVLDLGTARGIAYYTGIIFDIERTRGKGNDRATLGGGGRYDGLVKALGGKADIPALGFAWNVDALSGALPAGFGQESANGTTRVLVVAQETALQQAVETAERLRIQGIPAELDLAERTDEEAARYAQRRGIQTVMRVGRDGSVAERNA